jgi:hypothetical protein
MGRRAPIRAFWDVRHGDTIVGLIKATPTRGDTCRESSWAMSYTLGEHLGTLAEFSQVLT